VETCDGSGICGGTTWNFVPHFWHLTYLADVAIIDAVGSVASGLGLRLDGHRPFLVSSHDNTAILNVAPWGYRPIVSVG